MIAEGRRAAGLTQQQLADQAAVSVGAVRDLEQGRTARPRYATAHRLALVLGLDLDLVAEIIGWPAGDGHRPAPAQDAEPMTAGLRLGVLGPLAVWRDGIRADPRPGRQRAVLGLLAIHPGTALHRETIIDAVWGNQPPASAIAMVQSCVSQLRRLLGETVLTSDGTSYRLVLSAAQLDALEFARLAGLARDSAGAGNPAAACSWYDRALQLWRGDPLADVSALRGDPALTELAQQRAAVILDHADAAAAAGWPERVLPQLRKLASRDPLDERVHARLMLTLAACGQQAAALSVFWQLRQRLDAELGITPGAELSAAHLRILRGQLRASGGAAVENGGGTHPRQANRHRDDTARGGTTNPVTLNPPGPPPWPVRAAGQPARTAAEAGQTAAWAWQLPAAVGHFTGRAPELALLTKLLDQMEQSPGTVVISAIGGMAGIGKTALAVHWAHQVAAKFPDGQLYVNLRGYGPSGPPVAPAGAVAGFLDALGVNPERIPAAPEAQAALYRSMIAGKRLLMVLDNVRDEDQVRPLLPGSPGCLVIVTSRSQLTGLAAAEGADLLTLDVFSETDAHALLAARLGSGRAEAEPAAVAEIVTLCARLPLALAITASRAAARPRFSLSAIAAQLRGATNRLEALDTDDPAVSVRAVFAWSYQQLGPAGARMFELLGLHPGPDVTAAAAASLAGLEPPRAWRLLRELTSCSLLTEHSPGRYILHDLLRAYATERAHTTDDEQARHQATRRMLDHYLHTAHTAAMRMQADRSLPALAPVRPGVTPEHLTDHQQALAWFEAEHRVLISAVSLAASTGFDIHAWQLSWAMTRFLDWRGHWREWAAVVRTALAAVIRLGDSAAEAMTRRDAAAACTRLGEHEEARIHLATCLKLYRHLGDRIGKARVHQDLCSRSSRLGDYAHALGHAEQALALFRATVDRTGQASALNSISWCHTHLGNPRQARTFCRQALNLYRELGNRHCEALTWDTLGYAELKLGNLADAANCCQHALSLLHELGDRFAEAEILTHLGEIQHAAGAQQACQESWQQALDIFDELHHGNAELIRAKLRRASS